MKYVKKPVVIEAVQFDGTNEDELASLTPSGTSGELNSGYLKVVWHSHFEVHTLEGLMKGNVGDWLIRGVKGELYPCRDEIFRATYAEYEEVNESRFA